MSDSLVPASVSMLTFQEGLGAWGFPDWSLGLLPILQRRQLRVFLNLLKNRTIWECLHKDRCFQYSDKYLLAMVLVYFQRAHLLPHEYTQDNFFLALFLTNDIDEDLQEPKLEIIILALGKDWFSQKGRFLHQRDKLLARMDFWALVSHQSCEEHGLGLQPGLGSGAHGINATCLPTGTRPSAPFPDLRPASLAIALPPPPCLPLSSSGYGPSNKLAFC